MTCLAVVDTNRRAPGVGELQPEVVGLQQVELFAGLLEQNPPTGLALQITKLISECLVQFSRRANNTISKTSSLPPILLLIKNTWEGNLAKYERLQKTYLDWLTD